MSYYKYDEDFITIAKSACPNNCTPKVKYRDGNFRIISKLRDGTKIKFSRIDDRNQTARANMQQKYSQAGAASCGLYKSKVVFNEPVARTS